MDRRPARTATALARTAVEPRRGDPSSRRWLQAASGHRAAACRSSRRESIGRARLAGVALPLRRTWTRRPIPRRRRPPRSTPTSLPMPRDRCGLAGTAQACRQKSPTLVSASSEPPAPTERAEHRLRDQRVALLDSPGEARAQVVRVQFHRSQPRFLIDPVEGSMSAMAQFGEVVGVPRADSICIVGCHQALTAYSASVCSSR